MTQIDQGPSRLVQDWEPSTNPQSQHSLSPLCPPQPQEQVRRQQLAQKSLITHHLPQPQIQSRIQQSQQHLTTQNPAPSPSQPRSEVEQDEVPLSPRGYQFINKGKGKMVQNPSSLWSEPEQDVGEKPEDVPWLEDLISAYRSKKPAPRGGKGPGGGHNSEGNTVALLLEAPPSKQPRRIPSDSGSESEEKNQVSDVVESDDFSDRVWSNSITDPLTMSEVEGVLEVTGASIPQSTPGHTRAKRPRVVSDKGMEGEGLKFCWMEWRLNRQPQDPHRRWEVDQRKRQ